MTPEKLEMGNTLLEEIKQLESDIKYLAESDSIRTFKYHTGVNHIRLAPDPDESAWSKALRHGVYQTIVDAYDSRLKALKSEFESL